MAAAADLWRKLVKSDRFSLFVGAAAGIQAHFMVKAYKAKAGDPEGATYKVTEQPPDGSNSSPPTNRY